MDNQRLKDLFTIVLNRLLDENEIHNLGICHILYELDREGLLDADGFERYFLKRYLDEHKPTPENKYKEFTTNKHWIGSLYWWTKMMYAPETRQQRIQYLTMLISDMDE